MTDEEILRWLSAKYPKLKEIKADCNSGISEKDHTLVKEMVYRYNRLSFLHHQHKLPQRLCSYARNLEVVRKLLYTQKRIDDPGIQF